MGRRRRCVPQVPSPLAGRSGGPSPFSRHVHAAMQARPLCPANSCMRICVCPANGYMHICVPAQALSPSAVSVEERMRRIRERHERLLNEARGAVRARPWATITRGCLFSQTYAVLRKGEVLVKYDSRRNPIGTCHLEPGRAVVRTRVLRRAAVCNQRRPVHAHVGQARRQESLSLACVAPCWRSARARAGRQRARLLPLRCCRCFGGGGGHALRTVQRALPLL